MSTIRMAKGSLYADIYDSPETIRTAEEEGYVIVKDEPMKAEEKTTEKVETVSVHKQTAKRK